MSLFKKIWQSLWPTVTTEERLYAETQELNAATKETKTEEKLEVAPAVQPKPKKARKSKKADEPVQSPEPAPKLKKTPKLKLEK